jgi:hypothetical protein
VHPTVFSSLIFLDDLKLQQSLHAAKASLPVDCFPALGQAFGVLTSRRPRISKPVELNFIEGKMPKGAIPDCKKRTPFFTK